MGEMIGTRPVPRQGFSTTPVMKTLCLTLNDYCSREWAPRERDTGAVLPPSVISSDPITVGWLHGRWMSVQRETGDAAERFPCAARFRFPVCNCCDQGNERRRRGCPHTGARSAVARTNG